MFNIEPGQGLGFTGSKEIAFGLGTVMTTVVVVITAVKTFITKSQPYYWVTSMRFFK